MTLRNLNTISLTRHFIQKQILVTKHVLYIVLL